ncbi:MAG: ATP-binding protein [Polyangiales bacterium]
MTPPKTRAKPKRRKSRRRFGRFETKILGAMCLVALGPLIGGLVFGRSVLQDAYALGVNERFAGQLHRAVDIHRTYLVALREGGERAADAVAGSHTLRGMLESAPREAIEAHLQSRLQRYDGIARFRVLEGDEVRAEAEDLARLGDSFRELVQRRDVEVGGREFVIETVATAPESAFDAFQQAGADAELYDRLEAQGANVSDVYLWVYIAFLALVIVFALALAVFVARRITKRVTVLAAATRRLGGGDMNVTVPRESQDEVGELVEAFNTMVEDLRRSRERIDYLKRIGAWQEFARRLAHEIKNPLTPIRLAAQEIHRSYDGEDERFSQKLSDAKEIIEEEVETLRRLVGEFSSFAKLPSAALEAADLNEFVSDLELAITTIAIDVFPEEPRPATKIRLAPVESLPVQIDAMMLKRCVDNLVRNALQAMRGGKGSIVRVSVEDDGEDACISVEDDGPGIPKGDWESIFDPYFTTKSDGTGLGLAIVKKVILEHEGSITCEKSSLGGARMVIRVPLSSR